MYSLCYQNYDSIHTLLPRGAGPKWISKVWFGNERCWMNDLMAFFRVNQMKKKQFMIAFLHLQREPLLQHVQYNTKKSFAYLLIHIQSNSVTSNKKQTKLFPLYSIYPCRRPRLMRYFPLQLLSTRVPYDMSWLYIYIYIEFESRLTFAVGNSPAASMYNTSTIPWKKYFLSSCVLCMQPRRTTLSRVW